MNPEDLFRQAFGGKFDFESIFGSDAGGSQNTANQTRSRVSCNIICNLGDLGKFKFNLCYNVCLAIY